MRILIAAAAENNALGKDNAMLWHLPLDFKHFKNLTSGYPIIMGRKTFESLPGILPNRPHYVITRNPDFKPEGVHVVASLEQAYQATQNSEKVFVIGGGQIYDLALATADVIELTRVHSEYEADAFFPSIPLEEFELTQQEHHPADLQHAVAFTFERYERKKAME